MTLGSSMLEITFTLPAHSGQVSMSMLNTRPSLWAQVILEACWLAVRVLSSGDSLFFGFGTTSFRYLKFGANTPKNRIKFTLGRGTNEANLASKSSGSSTMCVVPLSPLSCIGEKLSKWIEEQIDWEARHIVRPRRFQRVFTRVLKHRKLSSSVPKNLSNSWPQTSATSWRL
jgi:hypothetical protein